MRDRYLGLVLAMLAWVLAPVSAAQTAASAQQEAKSGRPDVAFALASRTQASDDARDAAPSPTELPVAAASAHASAQSIADATVAHDRVAPSTTVSSAQPRGPPR